MQSPPPPIVAPESLAQPVSSPEPGTLLAGRYSLRRLIYKGDRALVYAAEDVRKRRNVAVKVSRCSPANLQREAEALLRIQGEGVVQMLQSGESDGRAYIVFELLEGRTLAGMLAARGTLAVAQVIEIGIRLSAALELCHSHGVVHRDIKPNNLFVLHGTLGMLKLLGFGAASVADVQRTAPENPRPQTPEYTAPEALLAEFDVNHRVDVYALGATLYECLTGAVPHEGEPGRLLLEVFRIPVRPVQEARDDVPPGLTDIVHRCLAVLPDDRFQSMGELCRALEACRTELSLAGGLVEQSSANAANGPEPAQRQETATIAATPNALLKSATSRRKHRRAAYTTLARILAQDGCVDGRIEEVSEGGLQFVGARPMTNAEPVTIRFALPATGRVASVTATARWSRRGRGAHATGFEFLDIDEGARAELRRYVSIMSADAGP